MKRGRYVHLFSRHCATLNKRAELGCDCQQLSHYHATGRWYVLHHASLWLASNRSHARYTDGPLLYAIPLFLLAWIHETDLPREEKHRLVARLAAAVWCFPRSLARHLLSAAEDENDYADDCRNNLRPDLAEDLIAARHKPTRAMYELSCAINEFPLSDWRRVAMDSAATTLCDAMGSSERIFTSPVPRFYTRHTARFLETWLLFMPLTLYTAFDGSWNHVGMIPATMTISFFLLGIEELGIQLEEPFSLLPQHKITNGIGLSAEEHVEWMLKDDENYRVGQVSAVNAALGKPLMAAQPPSPAPSAPVRNGVVDPSPAFAFTNRTAVP